jgi:threonine dehydrogenase-like Zn-dependent dehydrogenase
LPALDIWNLRVDALMYAFCTRGCDPAACDPPLSNTGVHPAFRAKRLPSASASDFLGTGHLAAVVAKVAPGKSVAVVGDGAVGLGAVIAAKRLGAEQIIIMGRHEDRIALAKEFGATDVVPERGEEAAERVCELTGGFGVRSVLECVGHGAAMETAIGIAWPGGAVGRVGVRAAHRGAARSRRSSATSPSAAARRQRAPTSTNCCPTSSTAASTPARCSTASSGWTACRTATAP